MCLYFFFFNDTATTEIYTLSLHDALPISIRNRLLCSTKSAGGTASSTPVMPPMAKVHMKPTVHSIGTVKRMRPRYMRSEEHTSELQSQSNLVCRLLLEKKKKKQRRKEMSQ